MRQAAMAKEQSTIQKSGLSIIIPAYNAADWIEPTVGKIEAAVREAGFKKVEIIIVDDGSSDGTKLEAQRVAVKSELPITVMSHKNKGRFLTRKRGVLAAQYETILFIDTRVWIHKGSLAYIRDQMQQHPDRIVWNGDVEVAKKGNIIARFGDAITCIGWRKYHGNRRLVSYGIEDFDYYPKGTTLFLTPKDLLLEGIAWFEAQTTDIRNSSDDTLLIRYIARRTKIWISPQFICTYFARTTLKAFIKHTYYRGRFFVDGFLRPGTRFFVPLIGFLVITALTPVLLVKYPALLPYTLVGIVILWLAELGVALALKITPKDALSLFILSPLFALFYGLGIWRATIKRLTAI